MNIHIKSGWIRATIFFFVVTVTFFLSKIIAKLLFNFFLTEHGVLVRLLLSQIVTLVFVFLIIYFFRKFIDRKSIVSLGFSIKNRAKDIIFALAFGFIIMALGFSLLLIFGNLEIIAFNFVPYVMFISLITLLAVSLIEEIIFRGYLLNNLLESINKYIALVIISVIFAVLHSLNANFTIAGLINLTLFGILIGIPYIINQNLWFPISFHLSWNYSQGPIFGFFVSGKGEGIKFLITQNLQGDPLITGGNFGFEGSVILTIILAISILILKYFYKTNKHVRTLKHRGASVSADRDQKS